MLAVGPGTELYRILISGTVPAELRRRQSRFVVGVHRRHWKVIGYLGDSIDDC
jgi:hypothetical protein